MTRKLQNPILDDARSRKRTLKPVVEKKRRDRINQSLAELRSLLLNHTSDPRLQNPKIEKAEILDLAVEYLQTWTDRKKPSNGSSNNTFHQPLKIYENNYSTPAPPPQLFSIQSAGFQQCMAQLTSYMHKITPAQRTSLIQGLKHHTETQQPKPDFNQKMSETETADAATVYAAHASERKDESSRSLFPSHSPFQPRSCSTPRHDYLSPPTSPWSSPSFSTYATSPPFPSLACHFSFPPSLSPPSSNASFYSFSPTVPHTGPPGLHLPPVTALRSSAHPAQREGSLSNSPPSMWRPWF
ncbi:hairy-related 11 [Toxotes jaculatrix]|uniref:hairy-related 11 n=1 Tax=Toxotes jaculatrix TaxID=941984 RepID=UPI001B3AF097|nr:hairy-related 11 [Toxotes jaculatrix]